MAAAEYYSGASMECLPRDHLIPQPLHRAQTEQTGREVDDVGVTQGCIMWLPAAEDLPERAVRRAHGKGAVEEGIYNHPVVIVSRPLEDDQCVHFHLITSLQGKKLDQLYPKANEFHTSRRSWYLPISPSPDHPDAKSKKAKKRFPTLALADGASLRWNSYVNIRHVYKIDWSLLKPYSNLNTPASTVFRLERDSTVRMIAKGRVLTLYEPSEQVPGPGSLLTRRTAPPDPSTESSANAERVLFELSSSDSDEGSLGSPLAIRTTPDSESPLGTLRGHESQSPETTPRAHLGPSKKRPFLVRVLERLFQRRQKG